jgi:hypothetical protein
MPGRVIQCGIEAPQRLRRARPATPLLAGAAVVPYRLAMQGNGPAPDTTVPAAAVVKVDAKQAE